MKKKILIINHILVKLTFIYISLYVCGCTVQKKSVEKTINFRKDFLSGQFYKIIDNIYLLDDKFPAINSIENKIIAIKALNEVSKFDLAITRSNQFLKENNELNSQKSIINVVKLEMSRAYIGKNDLDSAKLLFQPIFDEIAGINDREEVAYVYRVKSMLHIAEGNYRSAQNCIEYALEELNLSKDIGSSFLRYDLMSANLMYDLGELLFQIDNIEKAIALEKRSLSVFRMYSTGSSFLLLKNLISLSKIYLRATDINRGIKKDFFDAEKDQYYLSVKEALDNIISRAKYYEPTNKIIKAEVLLLKMKLLQNKDSEYSRGLSRNFSQNVTGYKNNIAQSIIDSLNIIENSLNPSINSEGKVLIDLYAIKNLAYLDMADIVNAEINAKKSYDIASKIYRIDDPNMIKSIFSYSKILYIRHEYNVAKKIEDLAYFKMVDSLITFNVELCKKYLANYSIGSTVEDLRSVTTAFVREPISFYLISDLKRNVDKEYKNISFFKNFTNRYEKFIHTTSRNLKLNDVDSLYNALKVLSSAQSDLVYEKWPSDNNINFYQIQMFNKSAAISVLWKRLSDLCYKYRKPSQELSIDTLKKNILDDEAILDFTHMQMIDGPDVFVAYVITKKGSIKKHILYGNSMLTIEELVRIYRDNALEAKTDTSYEYTQICGLISNSLWYPLNIDNSIKKLKIIPDYVLSNFPFGTLRHGDNYLIDLYEIGYYNDIHDILKSKELIYNKPKFLLLGSVNYGKLGYWGSNASNTPFFPYLPYSKKEIDDIHETLQHIFPDSLITVREDTSVTELFMKNSLNNFNIIHLSTHGYYSNSIVNYDKMLVRQAYPPFVFLGDVHPFIKTGIALSNANIRDGRYLGRDENLKKEGNNLLTAQEISYLNLENLKLILLSVCNSAYGNYYSGEGAPSITSAVNFSGAKNIVATLFNVDDLGSRLFMQLFYKNLASYLQTNDIPIAFLLKKTTKELREYKVGDERRFSAPKYWIPFLSYKQE